MIFLLVLILISQSVSRTALRPSVAQSGCCLSTYGLRYSNRGVVFEVWALMSLGAESPAELQCKASSQNRREGWMGAAPHRVGMTPWVALHVALPWWQGVLSPALPHPLVLLHKLWQWKARQRLPGWWQDCLEFSKFQHVLSYEEVFWNRWFVENNWHKYRQCLQPHLHAEVILSYCGINNNGITEMLTFFLCSSTHFPSWQLHFRASNTVREKQDSVFRLKKQWKYLRCGLQCSLALNLECRAN